MKTNILKFFGSLALLFAFVISSVTANAGTKDDVTKKGSLNCGVSQGVPGFSNADASGKWSGIDVDMCRAVAAAVFGDANKVKYQPQELMVSITNPQNKTINFFITFSLKQNILFFAYTNLVL